MHAREIKGSVLITDDAIVSKYLFTFELSTGLVATFNVNTDLSTPNFSGNNTLRLVVDKEDDLNGFLPFSGVIGEGRIQLTMKKGVKIEGEIEGGPQIVQSIVGFGTWLRS